MKRNFDQLNAALLECRLCPRLVTWRESVAQTRRKAYLDQPYWGRPVPGLGDHKARILIVGLAPGAHGSNRTGRMFTGDASGDFLYPALFKANFANQPSAHANNDGLELKDVFISAVCRCAPPGNKPDQSEITTCLPWLAEEISLLDNLQGFVVLGRIAYDGIRTLFSGLLPKDGFSHGSLHQIGENGLWVLCSYHPSRQNTQTGRLSKAMFDQIWEKAAQLLKN